MKNFQNSNRGRKIKKNKIETENIQGIKGKSWKLKITEMKNTTENFKRFPRKQRKNESKI